MWLNIFAPKSDCGEQTRTSVYAGVINLTYRRFCMHDRTVFQSLNVSLWCILEFAAQLEETYNNFRSELSQLLLINRQRLSGFGARSPKLWVFDVCCHYVEILENEKCYPNPGLESILGLSRSRAEPRPKGSRLKTKTKTEARSFKTNCLNIDFRDVSAGLTDQDSSRKLQACIRRKCTDSSSTQL